MGCAGGAARRALRELRQLASNAEVVSVMDSSEDRAYDVAENHDIPHACAGEETLLGQDIEAVYVASPTVFRAEQAVMAAEAGKHVLCAPPIAVSLHEVDRIAEACERGGVKFMTGFFMRHNPYHLKARELVQSRVLGYPVMGRAQMAHWYPPKRGAWRQNFAMSRGGALVDMGTHCLDLLEWILGASILEIVGFQSLMTHSYLTRIEDVSTILLRFTNGAHGIVDNYFNLPDGSVRNALEINGTRGALFSTGTIGPEAAGSMSSVLFDNSPPGGADAEPLRKEEYQLDCEPLYGQMLRTFTRCIIHDEEPPTTIEDGRRSQVLLATVYKAVRERRVIRLDV